MAITTLDGAIAGFRLPMPIAKVGISMAGISAMRGYTPWYAAGNPGASTATSIGVNGEAVTPALASVAGQIPRTNPVSGSAYVGRLAMSATTAGTLWLIDRVWQNSGLSVTSTSAQAITPASLPSRDVNGAANGDGLMAAIEWSATGGAGTPSVTLTYTNQSGTTGRTATLTTIGTPPVGTMEIFTFGAGDTGIRAPTSYIQSATRTSGAMHLVLFRVIAQVEVVATGISGVIDALTGGLPQVYDDSVLQLLWFPSSTTAVNLMGTYVETQG